LWWSGRRRASRAVVQQRLKTLKGRVENSSRQPTDLSKLGHKGSPLEKYLTATKKELLTLSREMVKKGVADDSDDDDDWEPVGVTLIRGIEDIAVKSQFK
jgi:hypothetical protein